MPDAVIDGNIAAENYGSYQSQINSERNQQSPLTMSLSGNFNSVTDTGHVIVTTYEQADSGYTSLRLRVVLDESRIHWVHSPGVSIHNQTFRDMMPNATGKTIALTLGQSRYDTFTFVARSPINHDSSEIVAFIQSDRTTPSPVKRILQAAKINVTQLDYNLTPFSLISPPNLDSIRTCHPDLVWHSASDPDSGFAVHYVAEIGSDPTFQNPPILSDTLSDTSWVCPNCLPPNTLFYWRVMAFNGHAPNIYSTQTFRFVVRDYVLNDFSLISPGDLDTIPVCSPTLIWHSTVDLDSGFAVNYSAEISLDSTFQGVSIFTDTLPDTSVYYSGCLMSDTTWYWRVLASNGHAPDRYSAQIFRLVVHEPGGCAYVPGDINNNQSVNGVDIVFAVNYLKGASVPPVDCFPVCPLTPNPFYAAGDVNGNCAFNGIDITYFVRFLKLQVLQLLSCPDCPPSSTVLIRPITKAADIPQ